MEGMKGTEPMKSKSGKMSIWVLFNDDMDYIWNFGTLDKLKKELESDFEDWDIDFGNCGFTFLKEWGRCLFLSKRDAKKKLYEPELCIDDARNERWYQRPINNGYSLKRIELSPTQEKNVRLYIKSEIKKHMNEIRKLKSYIKGGTEET